MEFPCILCKLCRIVIIFFLLLLNEAVSMISSVIGLRRNALHETASDRYMALIENQLPSNRSRNRKGVKYWESMECVVCLCEFKQGEDLRELKCKHAFHKDCLCVWLLQHREGALCPLCRSPVLPEEVMLQFWQREIEQLHRDEQQLPDWHFSFHAC